MEWSPVPPQRKGTPGLWVDNQIAADLGKQLLAEMGRGAGVWETKGGVIAACQPSKGEPRNGDRAGMRVI